MNQVVVVDANVVAKTFLNEKDSPEAVRFLRACVAERCRIIAPDLLTYEVAQVALKKDFSVTRAMTIFRQHLSTLIQVESPAAEAWNQADVICQHGHPKSGYPYVYDSIYHAMAIVGGGVFVTADRRHYVKAKSFGHIAMLSGWEAALEALWGDVS